jgi:hypothetical protein
MASLVIGGIMLLLELVILFAAGLFQDALNCIYVRSVAERALWRATALSGLVTILSFVVFARIVGHLGAELETAGGPIVAYALGNSAGTWVGLRRPSVAA